MSGPSLQGVVLSHTIIRVPGKAQAGAAPFVLLLVRLDGGSCVLGHFCEDEPPPIDARVVVGGTEAQAPSFFLSKDVP